MQRAILTGEQVKSLQETGEVVERVRVEPQPERVDNLYYWPSYNNGDFDIAWNFSVKHPETLRERCPDSLGTEGDLFWVAEEYILLCSTVGVLCNPRVNRKYKKDRKTACIYGIAKYETGILESYGQPEDMPQWASRYTIQTTSINPVEVDGVWFWERVRKVVEA